MKAVEAVFQHGALKPLEALSLREHQHVWLTIVAEEPSSLDLAELAAQSPSLGFLGDPAEDLYSLEDGQPVQAQ